MKHRLSIFTIYIVLGVSVLSCLTGCNTRSDELSAMLENSISTAQLTTGRELNRRYQDRETKPLLGKPKQPEVRIEYEPTNNYTKEDVYNEIINILQKNNWQKEELSIPQPGYYRASLQQDYFTILAEVLIQSKTNIVSITLVTVPS